MIIKDKSNNEKSTFEALELEDIFKFEDRLYMKVSSQSSADFNAYNFTKNRLTKITDDTIVQYVPSELILHERGWSDKND